MTVNALDYVRPFVVSVLRNWTRYQWSLQGFGMLRTYVSKELRLHVWDKKFAVPRVSTIHDHPWNFGSLVVFGRIVNTRYLVHRCTHTDDQVAALGIRHPFVKARIRCGEKGGIVESEAVERVWLAPAAPEMYDAGDSYYQRASEVHHSSYDDGTVTLVNRQFRPDTEHAHVFYKADESWVSAEPRPAEPEETREIVERALQNV